MKNCEISGTMSTALAGDWQMLIVIFSLPMPFWFVSKLSHRSGTEVQASQFGHMPRQKQYTYNTIYKGAKAINIIRDYNNYKVRRALTWVDLLCALY